MEDLLIVPAVLTANSLATQHICNNFTAYRELVAEKKYELINRITGSLFILYICYTGNYISSDEDVKDFIRQIAGYILYDTGHMILYTRSLPMYIHHCAFILFYLMMNRFSEQDRYIFCKSVWMLESTAPFLTVCWCLHLFKYPDTYIHKMIKIISFIYWTLIRIVYQPYYLYTTANIVVCTLGSSIVVLNIYWFRLLLKRVMG